MSSGVNAFIRKDKRVEHAVMLAGLLVLNEAKIAALEDEISNLENELEGT